MEQAKAAVDVVPDFLRRIVAKDIASGRCAKIHTRFPPEPNGFLHIGHAKAICLNFGLAREFGGTCKLRLDDTNPASEETQYAHSIAEDVRWLIDGWAGDCVEVERGRTKSSGQGKEDEPPTGFPSPPDVEPAEELYHASDYFDALYEFAVTLIKKRRAFVCDLDPLAIRHSRGAPDRPGSNSPFRERSVAESLDLFARMKSGEFPDGSRTLRAKIDMGSSNIWLRDPILYRIRHATHYRSGPKWCIYPLYDFAHCLSDYLEGITHSICTLEFDPHRPLYDWILRALDLPGPLPRQYEFARLNLSHTILSKRKLLQLVKNNVVEGWDDPRMPTISGLRRRGVPARVLRKFSQRIGVTKRNSRIDHALLDRITRQDLNRCALRRFVVLCPLEVLITNYSSEQFEEADALNNPEDVLAGTRRLPFGNRLYIEREDFLEVPTEGYRRLFLGGQVRLKYSYVITCDQVVKDHTGKITQLRCVADLDSRGGVRAVTQKVKGSIHWLSAPHAIDATINLYDDLFCFPEPEMTNDVTQFLNPRSVEVVTAKCEPSLADAHSAIVYQFERRGYFVLDKEARHGGLTFNRTIALASRWAKRQSTPTSVCSADDDSSPGNEFRDASTLRQGDPSHPSCDRTISIRGKWLRTAAVKDEWWLPGDVVEDPASFIREATGAAQNVDIVTFGQKPPNLGVRHESYKQWVEWDNVAAISVRTFKDWWERSITADVRQNVKKAWKQGVSVRQVEVDDQFIRSISEIYNETPVRQGKPFSHYGNDFETVRAQNNTFSDQTEFLGAYYEDELIGFIQLNHMGRIADIKQIISKQKHYDKKPGNVLIAKAVEVCAKRELAYLLYGKYYYRGYDDTDSLVQFKKRNGFKEVRVARYYVPLTRKGKVAVALKLHRGIKALVPTMILKGAVRARSALMLTGPIQKYLAGKQGYAR